MNMPYDFNSAGPQSETETMPTTTRTLMERDVWKPLAPTNLMEEDFWGAICQATELAVLMGINMPDFIRYAVGSYETSLNDVKSGHSAAYGWHWLTDEQREAVEGMDLPITEECLACGEDHRPIPDEPLPDYQNDKALAERLASTLDDGHVPSGDPWSSGPPAPVKV